MTAHNYQRESIELLERILDRVESIEKAVEEIRDELGDRAVTYATMLQDSFEDETGYH